MRWRALSPGAPFALIDDPALLPIPAQSGFADVVVGGQISLTGMADAMPVVVPISQIGRALRPLPVTHIGSEWQAGRRAAASLDAAQPWRIQLG